MSESEPNELKKALLTDQAVDLLQQTVTTNESKSDASQRDPIARYRALMAEQKINLKKAVEL